MTTRMRPLTMPCGPGDMLFTHNCIMPDAKRGERYKGAARIVSDPQKEQNFPERVGSERL